MSIVELIRLAKANNDFGVLSAGIPYMKTLNIEVHAADGVLTVELRADRLHRATRP